MHIAIRRAVATDAQALNALMHASSSHQGAYAPMLEGYAITPAQIERDLIFLAEGQGRTLGFYSLILASEPELDLMFVADDAQGLGLGEKLFRHMLDRARDAGVETVKIVSHPPAVGFYTRMGAEVIGAKPPAGVVTWARPMLHMRT